MRPQLFPRGVLLSSSAALLIFPCRAGIVRGTGWLRAAFLVHGGLLACTTPTSERQATAAPVASVSVPAVDFSLPRSIPEVLPFDRAWRAAARGEELDLAVLANRAGATRLLREASLGGEAGLVALRALPLAPDRVHVQGEACAFLARVQPSARPLLLTILQRLFRDAPTGSAIRNAEHCKTLLNGVIAEPTSPPEVRDLAQSILSSMALAAESASQPGMPAK